LGSPNPAGTNQNRTNLMGESMMNRFGPSNLDQLARLSSIKLRGY
jgi:hypothetical protein